MTVSDSPASGAAATPPGRRRGPLWWRRFRLLPRALRVSTYVAVLLVLALVVALLAGVAVVRRSFPQTTGTIAVPGLEGEVTVRRDDHGVPQIYAASTSDLMYAQGFVSAQERFFQMDVVRDTVEGRLAAMIGRAGLESDIGARTMGFARIAQEEVAQLDPSTRMALDSFADGVNAYLDRRSGGGLSLEYTLLGAQDHDYSPAAWTPVDSLSWLIALSWGMRGDVRDELARARSAAAVGATRAAQLFPAYDADRGAPIVHQGAVIDGVYEPGARPGSADDVLRSGDRPADFSRLGASTATTALLSATPHWLTAGATPGGSAVAVDGTMTSSGKPLLALASDLPTTVPGTWLQIGLHCTTVDTSCPYDVSGAALPGLPGVVQGHDADVAWGLDPSAADVADLRFERIRGDTWRYAGRWRDLTVRHEQITVADGADVDLTVRSTAHGPLVADPGAPTTPAAGGSDVRQALSLQWTGSTPHPDADAILALDRAHDWETFRDAAAQLSIPADLVYADASGSAGRIGYQMAGDLPVRKSGDDGLTPSDGWRPEDDWSDQSVPFDELPTVLDPTDHLIVAADQRPVAQPYPAYLGLDWDPGYRAARLHDLLAGRTGLDAGDLEAAQTDVRDSAAAGILPHLLAAHVPRGYYSAGQRLLRGWDGDQASDSAAAAYYDVTVRTLLAVAFHDDLPPDLWPDGGARWTAVLTTLLGEPASPWWDDRSTAARESLAGDLRTAMMRARDELTRRESPDPAQWSWGGLHRLRLRPPTTEIPLQRLFARDGHGVGGSTTTVDATAWDAAASGTDRYAVTTAPVLRMVVDTADPDHSAWVVATGVSGHAYAGHYTDQLGAWRRGDYLPWPGDPGDTLTLRPR